ncbi:MAG: TolB family protein, partial [Intestinibacter sp.]|uniref:TolB family protein n=1 Tax=Intestinibacter sp. TaxID=1965304 RepID=UPI003F16F08C
MGEKLQLEDMRKINFISSPDICPNNTKAVYTLYSTKEEDGDFYPKLYEVDLLSKNINKLNFGGEKELDAVYSSDGKKMAFISDRSGVSQLYLYDFENKDFSKLTSMIHGVESFKWSHKGDKIAFVTPLWPEDENIYEEMSLEERLIWKDKKENEPKVIEEIVYKYDDTKGVFDGSFKQIGLVDINTKEVSLLTEGNYNNTKLVWSYDDKMIAFLSNRRNHVEKLPNISDIYVLEVKNKYLKKLDIKHQVFDNTIEFTKDGKFIIYSGIVINEDDNALWIDKLFKCSIENGEEICITPKEESFHGINQSSVGKTVYGSENPTFCLSECGEYVYFKSSWDGSCNIYCVNLNGEPKIQKIT